MDDLLIMFLKSFEKYEIKNAELKRCKIFRKLAEVIIELLV